MYNITYTYDSGGNISRISNSAGGADGLGGNFTYNYSYDDLYRLDTCDGSGSIDASYTLAMAYSPSGNILKKTLAASKELLGNAMMESYEDEYSYGGAHTLAGVNDLLGGAPPLNYNFDGSGNMVMQQLYNPSNGQINEHHLCWDEENRLSATRDQYYATANIYDASGNRAWKLGGELNWMWNNGQGWQAYGDLNLRTWYQSDLALRLRSATDLTENTPVVERSRNQRKVKYNPKPTQHCSRTKFIQYTPVVERSRNQRGVLEFSAVSQNLKGRPVAPLSGDVTELGTTMTERLRRDFECLGIDYNAFYPGDVRLEALETLLNAPEQPAEYQVFFYHSDHASTTLSTSLGSSSFITDINGDATQHLQYLPFGEDLVHQQNTAAYLSPYTFSGKERDVETNLSYFGARYYEAGLSVWLSVDPMADMMPGITAYAFNLNSPILYKDPDGRLPLPVGGALIGFTGGFVYGAIKYGFRGDNWKRTLATASGAAVFGATFGLGGHVLAALGGSSVIGPASSLYILGGSALGGNGLGNLTDQSLNMLLGSQDGFNEGDFILSLALAIPEALMGEVLGNVVGGQIKSEMAKSISKNLSSNSRIESKFINETAKTIRKQSGGQISRNDARIAATKALYIARETEQELLNVTITISDGAVDVTNVGISGMAGDAIRSTVND